MVCLGSTFLTPETLVQTFFTANDSFPFLAIPFFILAGDIMLKGGLSTRIVGLARAFVGNITGSLGIITVLACMIFAAISGSGPATVAAIGVSSAVLTILSVSIAGAESFVGLVLFDGFSLSGNFLFVSFY